METPQFPSKEELNKREEAFDYWLTEYQPQLDKRNLHWSAKGSRFESGKELLYLNVGGGRYYGEGVDWEEAFRNFISDFDSKNNDVRSAAPAQGLSVDEIDKISQGGRDAWDEIREKSEQAAKETAYQMVKDAAQASELTDISTDKLHFFLSVLKEEDFEVAALVKNELDLRK